MSEYNLNHTGQELDDAINKVKSGYILPQGSLSITANGTYNTKNYESVVVGVPVLSHYKLIDYVQSSSNIESSHYFDCGFRPKIVLITATTDTTFGTTYSVTHAFRCEVDNLTEVNTGMYKLGGTNRLGVFGGGMGSSSFGDSGFTYSHGNIGFAKSVSYKIHIWG